jgi:hypothetical protein
VARYWVSTYTGIAKGIISCSSPSIPLHPPPSPSTPCHIITYFDTFLFLSLVNPTTPKTTIDLFYIIFNAKKNKQNIEAGWMSGSWLKTT